MTLQDLYLLSGPLMVMAAGLVVYWIATRPQRPDPKARPPAE